MTRFLGAVLAGGESRRMGAPKEALPLSDGRPMLLHVLDALRDASGGAAVVGVCRGLSLDGLPDIVHVPDESPGEGPLAGLVSLLAADLAEGYLMAACDQPLLTPALLRRLLEGNPERPRFFQAPDGSPLDPFPGYFPASLLFDARAAFLSGQRSLRRFVATLGSEWVPLASAELSLLCDVDTREDAAALMTGR